MGLSKETVAKNVLDDLLIIEKRQPTDKIVALAGNPNVGKSTVFNGLTGMKQHTGNWPGKTVSNAWGYCNGKNNDYIFVDIPGTYSLIANSAEEEIARDFICFGKADAVVVVCDATCIERNLNLVLQIKEVTDNIIVCVNLLDEAKRKKICIDLNKLSEKLGLNVVGTVARDKKSIKKIIDALDKSFIKNEKKSFNIEYPEVVENAIKEIQIIVRNASKKTINERWVALKLLDGDISISNKLQEYMEISLDDFKELRQSVENIKENIYLKDISFDDLREIIATTLVNKAEEICSCVVKRNDKHYSGIDRSVDKVLTSKYTGFPVMLIFLLFIFWLTIVGANYPSQMISKFLFDIEEKILEVFIKLNAPEWLYGVLVLGVYRVLAWVVAVMLPPMAMFFPLFTLLEDVGYLPRIAYNLDKPFKNCTACGKQALTMCMGFGCNAAGVIGCRIIDTPRERLLAILTNNFVPCNGRFPTLISLISMFFVGAAAGIWTGVNAAIILTIVILVGVLMTFIVTKVLSVTLLKGKPSTFILEMPPYRKPQVGKVIVRSIFDRTLFVLGRAIAVAAPAGAVIWIMANTYVGADSLLAICSNFLEPIGNIMGLDGVILMAFILGFPANEIVVPIMIMIYTAQGSLMEMENIMQLRNLLIENGWTLTTAICTMIFSIMHWPCSTTLLTIKKETNSNKWTLVSAILPTLIGFLLCVSINLFMKIIV